MARIIPTLSSAIEEISFAICKSDYGPDDSTDADAAMAAIVKAENLLAEARVQMRIKLIELRAREAKEFA